jgi:hypothetical protein
MKPSKDAQLITEEDFIIMLFFQVDQPCSMVLIQDYRRVFNQELMKDWVASRKFLVKNQHQSQFKLRKM